MNLYIHTYMYKRTRIHTHIHTHTNTHTPVNLGQDAYTRTYTRAHTHTHTYLSIWDKTANVAASCVRRVQTKKNYAHVHSKPKYTSVIYMCVN